MNKDRYTTFSEEEEKTEILKIQSLNNDELYSDFLGSQIPDDYDGEFTSKGTFFANQYQEELEKRLLKIGFITKA